MQRWVYGILGASVLSCSGALLWPAPVESVAVDVAPHEASRWSPTPWFADARRVPISGGQGPEDVEVDDAGRVFAGLQDGRILRWDDIEAEPVVLTNTGGRPLGLHWGPDGELWVADALAGLLGVDPDSGEWRVLTTRCGGRPLVFTDDLEVTRDGTAFFTDASQRYDQPHWRLDLIEGQATGRLCRWREGWEEAAQVHGGLAFANGVALDPFERFVLVAETARHRIFRLWIAGPRKGEEEIVIDDLPGYPDGISTGTDGVFWVALASPRKPELDALGPLPWVRDQIAKLPSWMQPGPARTARVLGIDAEGNVLHDHLDPTGQSIHVVTSVQERGGFLWFGSLVDEALARARRP